MNNIIFRDISPCRSCKNRRFGGKCLPHHKGGKNLRDRNNVSVLRFLVTIHVVPSSPIHVTLKMEAIHSSETPVLTKASRRHILEDDILNSHSDGNLKACIALNGLDSVAEM
jgi:hypothetical protein